MLNRSINILALLGTVTFILGFFLPVFQAINGALTTIFVILLISFYVRQQGQGKK